LSWFRPPSSWIHSCAGLVVVLLAIASRSAFAFPVQDPSGQNGPQSAPIYPVVNILAVQTTKTSNVWDLSVSNNTTTGLSALSFLTGVDTVSFTPDSGISASLDPALSGLLPEPGPDGSF